MAAAAITMVVKRARDGKHCVKCRDIELRLRGEGLIDRISRVVVADACDPRSEGIRLAARYRIDRAPFFLVETPDGCVRPCTVYLRLRREVRRPPADGRWTSYR